MLTHLSVDGVETNLDPLSISQMDVYTQNEGDQIFFHSTAFPRGIHGSTALYRGFRGSLPLCKSQFLIYACHYVSAAKDNVLLAHNTLCLGGIPQCLLSSIVRGITASDVKHAWILPQSL